VLLLAACFALLAAVSLGWLRWVRGRWLVVLGAMTYPFYLLHLDIGGTILYAWQRQVPAPLLVAVVTVAMVLLAWLVYRYVERPVAPLMKRVLLATSATVRQRYRAATPRTGTSSPPQAQVDSAAQPSGQLQSVEHQAAG
jgi:peptidoglycan/LPS O-acetylase OafA/YrhL